MQKINFSSLLHTNQDCRGQWPRKLPCLRRSAKVPVSRSDGPVHLEVALPTQTV